MAHTDRAVIQVAYLVPDIAAACARFQAAYGIGPFFHIAPRERRNVRHFGQPIDGELVTEAALAQAGDVMVELLSQRSDVPSAYRDMFGPDEYGFHHVAFWTDDYAGDIADYEACGFDIAMEMEIRDGLDVAYVDTRETLGHMIELLPRDPSVVEVFALVRETSAEWIGDEILVPMPSRGSVVPRAGADSRLSPCVDPF
jgi:catechol 2,3-dioxygenase-like lactoylglutathione lyase family enzyme